MSAVNVGNLSLPALAFSIFRDSQWRKTMSRVNAGNLFLINPVSDHWRVHIGESAL